MIGMILAAGYGTRFLPATKTIPKEMIPLIDKPAIHFIIEEFVDSGIKDIVIITSRRKKPLEDYLDREIELETQITDPAKLEKINTIKNGIKFYFIRQQKMGGTGDAVLLASKIISSPFVLAFPDDIVFSANPLAKQLIDVYHETHKNVLAVMNFDGQDVSPYGVVNPGVKNKKLSNPFSIKGIVEKPKPGTEPSSMISIGRYLLTSDIFTALEDYKKDQKEEFYMTDALNQLSKIGRVLAYEFEGNRYDIGTPQGFMETITDYALSRKDLSDKYKDFLKQKML